MNEANHTYCTVYMTHTFSKHKIDIPLVKHTAVVGATNMNYGKLEEPTLSIYMYDDVMS